MTVELCAHNRPVQFSVLKKVTYLQDLLSILQKICTLKMCKVESCTVGYFEPMSSIRKARSDRCKNCRLECSRKKDYAKKIRKRAAARHLREKTIKKQIRQKCSKGQKRLNDIKRNWKN